MMGGLWRGEHGQALLIVMAFMLLSLPLVTSALGYASVLLLDSRVKNNLLKRQYSALGGQQLALHNILGNPSEYVTSTILNGELVTTTVELLLVPPGEVPFELSSGRLAATKSVNTTTAATRSLSEDSFLETKTATQ